MDMFGQPSPPPQAPHPPIKWHHWLLVGGIVVAGVVIALLVWWAFVASMPKQPHIVTGPQSQGKPSLTTATVVGGYDHIWDIIFLPSKEMVFNERSGKIHIMLTDGKVRELHKIQDIYAVGEGGLLGMAVDPKFAENRYIYACFNSIKNGAEKREVRLARFKVSSDLTKLEERTDIVTGMPSAFGRHSGCRPKFGPDGFLYVGTGDAALGGMAADHKALGGKILRIDRDGDPAPGNLGGDFDPRIFSYGHRNVQGIAFFPTAEHGGVLGVSVEHGSSIDDEVNLLKKGNFGWLHPAGTYHELDIPMTDKTKDPNAIDAIWSSGTPTQAPSGATFMVGTQWKYWNGALVVAVLKDKHLKILTIDSNNKVTTTENVFVNQFGRLRTTAQGPDGNLYIATDNGKSDQIIRVTPN
jgi:glucose/arabinose dehydrogenase